MASNGNALVKLRNEVLSKMTVAQLVETFEYTSGARSLEMAEVRGWLMDELEKRDPTAFEAWLDLCISEDSPRKFFIKSEVTA